MKRDQYKHVSVAILLAFFMTANWGAAPRSSSASASPTGIVRLALNCHGDPRSECMGFTFKVGYQINPCRLPAIFNIEVEGGLHFDTAPQFLISVKDPAGNDVPVVVTSLDGRKATFQGALAGRYMVTIIDANGCTLECSEATTIPCCSFTQERYGRCTDKFNGDEILKVIRCLNNPPPANNCNVSSVDTNPLQIGIFGMRSLTFNTGSERCLIEKLPASGIPGPLPVSFNETITSPSSPASCQLPGDCQFPAALPIDSAGKFNNVLIGQSLALTLNARLDGDIDKINFSTVLITHKVLPNFSGRVGVGEEELDPGPDGVLGTRDDPITIVTIPRSVINAIAAGSPLELAGKFSQLESPGTIDRVIKLANLALAGETNLGVTFVEINAAAAAINKAFDQCTMLTKNFNTDTCLQDSEGLLSFNSTTGDYVFTRCGPDGFNIAGTATLARSGCTLTVQHNADDRRILATINTCQNRGIASVQYFPRATTFSISDRNITDNTCACP